MERDITGDSDVRGEGQKGYYGREKASLVRLVLTVEDKNGGNVGDVGEYFAWKEDFSVTRSMAGIFPIVSTVYFLEKHVK